METMIIDMKNKVVKSFDGNKQSWNCCSFYEAGLYENIEAGKEFSEINDIEDWILDREYNRNNIEII